MSVEEGPQHIGQVQDEGSAGTCGLQSEQQRFLKNSVGTICSVKRAKYWAPHPQPTVR